MKTICVFCGSSPGIRPAYADAARATAQAMYRQGLGLVYGGGKVGLMGIVADEMLNLGGEVVGVMPRALVEREIAHPRLTRLHVVETMHARKTLMSELGDAFLALPGGAGTLEEIFEQWTWAQLGIHAKPCGFLNAAGYFDPLIAMVRRAADEAFMAQAYADMLVVEDNADAVLARFAAYRAPPRKWMGASSAPVAP